VTERYQSLYLGLRERECLIPPHALLERFAARLPLAIVTGRPRAEAQWFLERAGISQLFSTVVVMEEAPAKPNPAPVRLALDRLGVRRAWMIGDTPDDMRAAAQAGVLPLAVAAPGDEAPAGGARVLGNLTDLLELLP
jgi:HAD superfamily hydrolase (TIGR01549 family)